MLTNQQIAEAAKKYSLEGFLKRHSSPVRTISLSELETECHAFEAWEPRDSTYRVSTFLVREWWGDPAKLVDGLSVLLLIWNGAFYRYGTFDESTAETCLRDNQTVLDGFRGREIASFNEADEKEMGRLFNLVSKALGRKVDCVESPVSAGRRSTCWPRISFLSGISTSRPHTIARTRENWQALRISYSHRKFERSRFNSLPIWRAPQSRRKNGCRENRC